MLRKHLYRIRAMPYLLWTIIFTIVPLFFIIYYSFKVKDESFVFTLDNYKKFFTPTYLKIIFVSLKLSLISTFLCLILGYPAGLFLSRIKAEKRRNILVLFFIMPLWTNFLLRTYSWMSIFREQGIINQMLINVGIIDSPIKFLNNNFAIIIGMIYNFLPFMVLPIYTALINIDKEYIECAKDLGAKGKDLFFRVIFPLSFKGVISGCIMVFMPSVTTFIISDLLGGSQNMLVGNLIQREFLQARNWETGSSISLIMIFIIFVSLMIFRIFVKKSDNEFTEGFKIW
ncbi:ABC transporter permease [Parvimonas micra]|mgnify:FL=1|uniref:ABC transporter permease n=1 Tax=Parvimonas micra TaxID=33033 RepID=UPI002003AA1F|nr:ABC transporter permease [Parvimonas micra]MCK6130727.1 ABC transporter permease [Parvimonas micra]MCK6136372.1 ABC transporter permease [Parvimonas micra]MCK6137843.1 ABC transporter permease [Parvimonas micra]MCK6154371.1 ABC transporter permease [Parvimonas micra]